MRPRPSLFTLFAVILVPACSATPQTPAPSTANAVAQPLPRLSKLTIPGDPTFVRVARDVIDVAFTLDGSLAANAGLFDDALRVPTFASHEVSQLERRLNQDLRALRRMPWRTWAIDAQIDFRWIYANAEGMRHQLSVERQFTHRPASWLEPFANTLIAFASYIPGDRERPRQLWAQVPAMVDEMRAVARKITRRDRDTARRMLAALIAMADTHGSPDAARAKASLTAYDKELAALHPRRDYAVIGAAGYAYRLRHVLLLKQRPAALLSAARSELARVEAEIAELTPKPGEPPAPTEAQKRRAAALSRDSLLALYDAVEVALRRATLDGGWVTIPPQIGPLKARETPDAMVPLTGDGGSMNPPPPFADITVGYWNVEHFRSGWSNKERLDTVTLAEGWRKNFMGPYAAHEGFPGHHLQLALARLHPDPIRTLLADPVMNEGWGLYAEEELWRHGGFGPSPEAHRAMLRSYRYRIARVIYDVNVETGAWSLQRGADFKDRTSAGKGKIDEEILRTVQWPTQLISYFVGKAQIVALREAMKKKLGAAYTDRAFHDSFLAEGSIPVELIRAKLLGEPVPGI